MLWVNALTGSPSFRIADATEDPDELAYREWHLLVRGEDGTGSSVLGTLIRQTEGPR